MTTELVPSVSISNMVNQRAAVISLLQQACAKINEASMLATAGHLGMPRFMMTNGITMRGDVTLNPARIGAGRDGARYEPDGSPDADVISAIARGVDAAAWQYLMSESGLRSLMDSEARSKWDKSITEGDFPEFTEANVRTTFRMLHDSRGDMFDRGVIACFKSLAWCYKTNLPQKFGKRIVIKFLRGQIMPGSGRWSSPRTSLGSPNYDRASRLDDLSR